MPNYGDPKYWDKRYAENSGSMFDWLEDYRSLKPLLSDLLTRESKVLVLGCGNAEFSEDLYDDGYHNLFNIDISSVVITQMSERNKHRDVMKYEVMDVRDIKYADGFFDVAIDKSTIDALLCGDNAYVNVAIMLKEVQRVLKPGGFYIAISYGKPESRSFHFEREHLGFSMKQYILYPADAVSEDQKEEKSHFIYVCRKNDDADRIAAENYEKVLKEIKRQQEEEAVDY